MKDSNFFDIKPYDSEPWLSLCGRGTHKILPKPPANAKTHHPYLLIMKTSATRSGFHNGLSLTVSQETKSDDRLLFAD